MVEFVVGKRLNRMEMRGDQSFLSSDAHVQTKMRARRVSECHSTTLRHWSIRTCSLFNRRFAAGGHAVQDTPYWNTKEFDDSKIKHN